MNCPNCGIAMEGMPLEARFSAPVEIELCAGCQAFWFDKYESLKLAPGSTLRLMKFIGEHTAPGKELHTEQLRCPRCAVRLKATTDMQRDTKFSYWRCPQEHGRFIRFFEFLREKNFIRPLSPQQIAELRKNIQIVNCSSCGAPIDLAKGSACSHCSSPISMLDMNQPQQMLAQLRQAAEGVRPIDTAVLLELTETHPKWQDDAYSSGLVQAGLSALARWLNKSGV